MHAIAIDRYSYHQVYRESQAGSHNIIFIVAMENGMDVKRVKVDKGSLFGHLDICPPDSIFHVKDAYLADKSSNKVNLGIGGEIINL